MCSILHAVAWQFMSECVCVCVCAGSHAGLPKRSGCRCWNGRSITSCSSEAATTQTETEPERPHPTNQANQGQATPVSSNLQASIYLSRHSTHQLIPLRVTTLTHCCSTPSPFTMATTQFPRGLCLLLQHHHAR